MKDYSTSSKISKTKPERQDDSPLSKNHAKSVRYRIREQKWKEAEEELKEFEDELNRTDRLY